MTATNTLLIVVMVGFLGVGAAVYFVGLMVAVATALGNRRWLWGIVMLCFPPLALVYSGLNRTIAGWPFRLLLGGFISISLAALLGFMFVPQIFDPSILSSGGATT